MAVGDEYRVAHNQTVHGITCVNLFVYQQTGAHAGVSAEQDLAEAFNTTVVTPMRPQLGPQWRTECLVVSKIAPGPATKYHLTTGLPGTWPPGEQLPAKSVAVISHYTTQLGKRGRGRWFLSGMGVDDEEDNCWDDGAFPRLSTIGALFIANAVGGSGGGTYDPGMVDSVTGAFSPIIRIEVRNQVRSLRSRTQRRACG